MSVSLDAIGFSKLSLFIVLISVESSNIWLKYIHKAYSSRYTSRVLNMWF